MRENSKDKHQQAKDRKTEYFLGNWNIQHVSSEIIGPLGLFRRARVHGAGGWQKASAFESTELLRSLALHIKKSPKFAQKNYESNHFDGLFRCEIIAV